MSDLLTPGVPNVLLGLVALAIKDSNEHPDGPMLGAAFWQRLRALPPALQQTIEALAAE